MSFKKKYAVIGGAGFIGSSLVDHLILEGHNVLVIDNLSTGKATNINKLAEFICVSIELTHPTVLKEMLDGCVGVYFLAAKARVQPSFAKALEYNEVNVKGLLSVLEAMRMANITKIIYSSSSSVYGDASPLPVTENSPIKPLSPYGLQKYIGEEYCELYTRIYNMSAISLRYFNVYGNRMLTSGQYTTCLGNFIKRMRDGNETFLVTNDGNQTRDFTHVFDVVSANMKAMNYLETKQKEISFSENKNETIYNVFNIGAGQAFSINKIVSLFGKKPYYVGEKIEPKDTLSDTTKAQFTLGWYPRYQLDIWVEERVAANVKRMEFMRKRAKIKEEKNNVS